MSIVDQFGNPITSASRHFAEGANRNDRAIPPQPLYKDDFEKLIPDLDRQSIVSASRKLFSNYGPIRGAIVQKANNVVGRAWSPRHHGTDTEWGKVARTWLETQWYGNCDVRGRAWDFKTLLWLDSVAIDRDGDFLIYLTEAQSGYPLMQRISVNRIGQRSWSGKVLEGRYKGLRMSHGVVLDKVNRAIAFHILGDTAADDRFIEARDCIHVFDPAWHDQVRGIPAFDGAIKTAFGSFTATEREQLNQNIRSSIALIEYNETGGPDLEDPSNTIGRGGVPGEPAGPTVQNFHAGLIKYIRSNSGGKMEALDNDMPGDAWDRFQDRVIRMGTAYFDWPFELVWKSDQLNAALVRNVQERARQSVEDRQDVLRSPATFVVQWAIAKAIKVGILPAPKDPDDWWKWTFQMPRKFSVDQAKDAKERREDWKIGFRSRRDIAAEDGRDVEEIENEKIDDAFRIELKVRAREESEGITIDRRTIQMLTSNETLTATDEPTPDRDEDEEKTEETKEP